MSNYLSKLLGEESVSENESDIITYSTDASQLEGLTSFVVWPKTKEQVHQIILYARRNKKDLVVRGAGTNLVGSVIPQNSIVMDMSKMNRILKASKLRFYVEVEPGANPLKLNNLLKKVNLELPVTPSSEEICTIGGMVATNCYGIKSTGYGSIRKWVSQLEIIDGSGRLITVRGSKIEDFCGTEGTAGIITRVKLKLIEKRPQTSITIYEFDDISDLLQKSRKLKNENVLVMEFISKQLQKHFTEDPKHLLIVEYESGQGQITEKEEIERILDNLKKTPKKLFSEKLINIEDVRIKEEDLQRFLVYLEDYNIPSYGSISLGIIHPIFKKIEDERIGKMYEFVKEKGNSCVGSFGIGISKKKYASYEIKEKIKKLKLQYDPDNILNKGKII